MVYYKLILDTRRKKTDNTYPVVVRITYERTYTTITTGVRIKEEHWDFASQLVNRENQNFQTINKSISESYLKIQKTILKIQEQGEFSFELLKSQLLSKPVPKLKTITFLDFTNKLINEMVELNQTGNALVYQTALKRIMNYCNNDRLTFQDIDYNLLNGYKQNLQLSGVKPNTISNYFRTTKAIYNKAIKAKIVERSLYPFLEIPIKQERTPKRAISLEDIQAILKLDLKENFPLWHSRNYFLLSFLLIGISFSDMAYLKPTNIVKGRLIFNRRKTHKNYSIKLHKEAEKILLQYRSEHSKYLLPILTSKIQEDSLEAKKIIHQWIKTTNKYLKRLGDDIGLESPLTTYVARHTWATTAKKLGYSNEVIAEAMGHEYGNRITSIYLDNFEPVAVDDMSSKICEKLFIRENFS